MTYLGLGVMVWGSGFQDVEPNRGRGIVMLWLGLPPGSLKAFRTKGFMQSYNKCARKNLSNR